MVDDDPNLDDVAETGPLDQEGDHATTTALPRVVEDPPTEPVQRSMLSMMAPEEDETEFLRQDDVDASYDPTEELHSDNMHDVAKELGANRFDAETLETGEEAALRRRRPPATLPDDSDVVTLETDEERALQRRRRRPPERPKTRPAVLLDAPTAPLPPERELSDQPPTQPRPSINPPPDARPLRPPPRNKSAPFWKRESFWRAGQATQAAEVLRVPISEEEMSMRERRAFKVALAGGFLGAVVTLAIAMSTWMAPLEVIALALALVFPVAAATAWLSRPEDLSHVRPEDFQMLLKPVAAGAAVLLLFSLPWQLGVVRSLLRPFTASSPAMSLQILQDRSDGVAIDECVRIAPNPQRVKSLAAGLPGRVEVTRACFEQVTDQPEAAARDLLSAWRPLMVTTVDSKLGCGMAESAAVLPLPAWELRSAFVDCVIEGSADVQECCGEALQQLPPAREDPPAAYTPDEPAAGSWLRFSLGKLTPRQKKIRDAAGLEGGIAEQAAINFACRAVDGGANMGPAFVESLKSCGIGPEMPTDQPLWKSICASMRQRHAAQTDRTQARALCDAARAGGAPIGTQSDEPAAP